MSDLQQWQDNLEAKLAEAVKIGKDLNIDEYEIFMSKTKSVNIELMNGLVNGKNGGGIGCGVKVVDDKRIGYASASGLNKEGFKFAFENALSVAKSLSEENKDEKWEQFHSDKSKGEDGIIDRDIVNYTSEQAVNQINFLIDETKSIDDRIFSVGGSYSANYGVFGVANSEDILKSSLSTAVVAYLNVTAKENEKRKSDTAILFQREVPKTLEGMTEDTAKKVINMLESEPLNADEQLPVVFDARSASQMFGRSLSNSVNAESVLNERSGFADKIGSKIGMDNLTIKNDGQAEEIVSVSAIDHEGVAKQTNTLIEDGVLLSYIFDDYHARIFESEPAGNAFRGGGQNYERTPNIFLNPLVMTPGSKSMDDIITEIDRGVLCTSGFMGLHTTDTISGDYSIVSQTAFLIEDGEISTPLDSITLAGNHYDFFKDIKNIGNEQDIVPGFASQPSKIPSVEVSGITVSG